MAFGQVRPHLRAHWSLSESFAGNMYSVISLGTIAAYALVRLADRVGRRPMLTATIAGYTSFTFLSGLAPDPYTYTAVQALARVFLVAEWAISFVFAAEEFPAARRGAVIGVIQACNAFGAIVCAGVAPLLVRAPWGWRTVYLVAIPPLLLIMYARRGLRETRRFESERSAGHTGAQSLFRIFRTPHRRTVFKLAALWSLMYMSSNVAVAYWKDFAVTEAGLTDGEAGASIAIAAVASLPLVFVSGRLLDAIGRRHGGAVIFGVGALGTALCYTLDGRWPLTATLVLGVFGASAMPSVLNALTTEMFPTHMRADAFAWCNNLLGRVGYVAAPAIVSNVADHVGALGPVVAATAVFPLLAVALMYALLPETRGLELERTSAVAG
ncbi:MAG: MFS transporter [Deltaproteobacteria bacterium]|nr:MAG: MFS transporter [Deltaproteobacteria bacterium]